MLTKVGMDIFLSIGLDDARAQPLDRPESPETRYACR